MKGEFQFDSFRIFVAATPAARSAETSVLVCVCLCLWERAGVSVSAIVQNQNTNTSTNTNVCCPSTSRITPIPGQKGEWYVRLIGVFVSVYISVCNPENTMTNVIALSLLHSFYLFFQFVCACCVLQILPLSLFGKKNVFHFNFISFQPEPSLSHHLAISVARSGGLQPINTSERESSIFA